MEKKNVRDYIQTVEGYRQFRDKVDEILLNFDFEKVHRVLKTVDWTWACWEDREGNFHENEVPDVYALRCQARGLLISTVEKCLSSESCSGTGGFEVECYVYDLDLCEDDGAPYTRDEPDDFKHSVCLSLAFVLEESGKVY